MTRDNQHEDDDPRIDTENNEPVDRKSSDSAPTVYLEDGTPVKVRVVDAMCEGEVSGEGHYGYRKNSDTDENPTVYFEEVNDTN